MDRKWSVMVLVTVFLNSTSPAPSMGTGIASNVLSETRDYKLQLRPAIKFDWTESFNRFEDPFPDNNKWLPRTPVETDTDDSEFGQNLSADSKQGEGGESPQNLILEPLEPPISDSEGVAANSKDDRLPPVLTPSFEGLERLSPIGFIKLPYFLIPFLLPIVFVPLLFVSMAFLMIPVLQITTRIDKVRHLNQQDIFQGLTTAAAWKLVENIGYNHTHKSNHLRKY